MKNLLIGLLFVFISSHVSAQGGTVYDDLSLPSKILKSERKYAIYLPPDYQHSNRSYPVLYLLHGYTDDHTGWVQFGEVKHIADKAIKEGKATPMIIVMPDADTGIPGYVNTIDGKWNYEDFFFEELMPFVEKKYRIKSQKRYRAVSGLSMGGGGTFLYALHHPELFSSACPLSAWLGPKSEDEIARFIKNEGIEFTLDPKKHNVEEFLKNNYALNIVDHMDVKQINSVRWYIDCGDDDFLYEDNSLMHIAMRKKEIRHEFRIRDGAHNWTYWRASLPDVLAFVSQGFHQY
jgi:enterochelin esterase-like enzyme